MFIFRVKQFRIKEYFLHYLTLMMKALSFETLDTKHQSPDTASHSKITESSAGILL